MRAAATGQRRFGSVNLAWNGCGVGRLRLEAPERANALRGEDFAQIAAACAWLHRHVMLRLLLVTGAGRHFCAGADLGWMRASTGLSEADNKAEAQTMATAFSAVAGGPWLTVAWVGGACYGGGLGLAAACDLLVSRADARFCLSELRFGLVPAVILPYLRRRLPAQVLRRMVLTGEISTAAQGQAEGWIDGVAADTGALAQLLAPLASQAPHAVRVWKRIESGAATDLAGEIAALRCSEATQRGLEAFAQGSSPDWGALNLETLLDLDDGPEPAA